jgi:hypothetical protein
MLAARGYGCVKAYNELEAPALAAVCEVAQAQGLPVIGHVPRRIPLEQARLDDVQHLTGVALARDPAAQFRERLFDFESPDAARLEAVIEASLAERVAHTPTLVTVERLLASERLAELLALPELRLLPRF